MQAVARAFRILLDDDRIGALWHGGAGEDTHGLASPDAACEAVPRLRFPDHGQACVRIAGVGRAHRIAVHGGGIERRLRQLGDHVLRKHAAGRIEEPYALGSDDGDAVENAGQRLFDGNERHDQSSRPALLSAR